MAWAEKAAFTSYFAILVVPCWADRNSTLLSKLFLSSMSARGDTECPRVCVMGRSRSPAALAGGGNFTSHYRGGSPAQGAAGTGNSSASPGLSWRKSCKRGNVERHRIAGVPGWEHGEPSAPDPAEGPMCSLCWRGDRKENSAVIWDLGGLLSHFSPSSPHMAFLCSKQICHSLNDPEGYPDWVPAATWLRFILPSW